ncbi:MAG: hypothetical protein ACOYOF_20820 [Verrucomicrobiaceae bacterium]
MKKGLPDYQKLLGRSLWEGPDHLLYIQRSGFLLTFKETYKRIDYAKVQCISYGRTRSYLWTSIWLVLLLLPLVWGLLANLETPIATGIFGGLTGLVLIFLIVHLARGPTCLCKIQTAVQVLRLTPLKRVRAAMPVVARLTQLCLQHQGGQAPSAEALAAAQGNVAAAASLVGAPKPAFPGSRMVTIAMVLLVVGGFMSMADPFIDHFVYFFVTGLVGITSSILGVTALARNFRYQLPGSLKISLWGAAANVLLSFVTGYALLIMASIKSSTTSLQPGAAFNASMGASFNAWTWMSSASLADMGWIGWLWMLNGGLAVVCGFLGLPAALNPPGTKVSAATPPPLAPTPPDVP